MKERIIELLKQNTSLNTIDINDILGLNTPVEFSELQKLVNEMCEEGILYHSNKDKYLLFENVNFFKEFLFLKEYKALLLDFSKTIILLSSNLCAKLL